VRDLCDRHGTAYIADEVQTGLGRTGHLWGVQAHGVLPDILVTGKGLSGGLYPIAAALLSEPMAGWLREDGWSHISTFGGAELGCRVARSVLDLTAAIDVAPLVEQWRDGLAALQQRHPSWLVEVRQSGLVIGLRFAGEAGGLQMTRALYDQGVWAMFAGFDPSVLQVKPGLLLTAAETQQALAALDRACAAAAGW
jgi:acetylornithine/succinyldiaminopimelate/putrescine aminotransferase